MSSQNYQELYKELQTENANIKSLYESKINEMQDLINKLNESKINLENEISSLKEVLKIKNNDLVFLSEQYRKLFTTFEKVNNELKCTKEIKDYENDGVDENMIFNLLKTEIENIKKEQLNYINKTMTIENFTFEIIQKNKFLINNMNNKNHKLISDNVDQILFNIQKKKEKLILTEKMINEDIK